MAGAFDYPPPAAPRRHGPQGYSNYLSYRPWLRDEFSFRCVYCLLREQWGRVTGEFDVEHFVPQAHDPRLALDYENLLYACHSCNILKGSRSMPNPSEALTNRTVRVKSNGALEGRSAKARRIIDVMGLNSPSMMRWRLVWTRNVQLAAEFDQSHYERLMGYPADLPDLARLRPPGGNSRPEGIGNSCLARRARGELPAIY
jgi:hypothetical protein